MLLSIITINLNNAEGLRRTLRSIGPLLSDQVEHIVIDGQSSDSSGEVIAQYTAGRSHVRTICECDTGIYNAMNKGIDLARGHYIAYINSGDEAIPDAYARYLDVIGSRRSDVFYAKTQVRPIDEQPVFIHERHPDKLYRDTLPHLTCAVRKSVLQQLQGFDESYRICADRDLMIRLQQANASFSFHDDVVSIFELGGVSSGRSTKMENLEINRKHRFIGLLRYHLKRGLYRLKSKA
ncbi:MAG: glycosyltransferase [Aquabacterium sp.]|uniref:glycosyltransferase n=1 Tax=Aquabacterium sp. TaxID=1872578 RepID=UPI00271AC087|nr:glycosyltransferase [Aquabacterium sp.]MDO9006023.1 glycosyltransferase [Aquabacterium sp.]